MESLLVAVFPDHRWEFFKFQRVPKHYWKRISSSSDDDEVKLLQAYLDEIASKVFDTEELGGNSLERWYSVAQKNLSPGQREALKHFGGIGEALARAYPHHQWDQARFKFRPQVNKRVSQGKILKMMKSAKDLVEHESGMITLVLKSCQSLISSCKRP